MVASTERPSARGSSHLVAWVVFALGAALIVLARGLSLRAKPLRASAT